MLKDFGVPWKLNCAKAEKKKHPKNELNRRNFFIIFVLKFGYKDTKKYGFFFVLLHKEKKKRWQDQKKRNP